MLQAMASQRVGHDLAAEQHQATLCSLNLSLAPPPIHSASHSSTPFSFLLCLFVFAVFVLVLFTIPYERKAALDLTFEAFADFKDAWFS